MSTWFGSAPARLAFLALLAVVGFASTTSRADAQTAAFDRSIDAPAAHPQTAAPATALGQTLNDKVNTGRAVRVIARLRANGGVPASGVAGVSAIAGSQDRLARRLWNRGHSMPGWHAFQSVPAIVMEVDPSSLASLATDPEVEGVDEDRLSKPDLSTSVPLVNGPAAWAAGYTGQGVAVAILDTGVEASHPFFGGRVVHEACFSSAVVQQGATSLCPNGTTQQTGTGAATPCPTTVSGCFHGTHVAGIAAGYQSASFAGVAKGANIIAIQVFTRFDGQVCGGGTCVLSFASDQIRALDYVYSLTSTYTIASVNMSLGGSVYNSQASCDTANQPTKAAIDKLRAVGTATVIAAGNDGYLNAMSEPGCISSAISVGNTNNSDGIFMPSNISSFITVMAPGTSIRSSVLGGAYGTATGTSMSTPHIAGALAVLRQAKPSATVSEMISALRNGGKALTFNLTGGSGQTYKYTVPRLDVMGALNVLRGTVTPATGWWWNPAEPGRGFSLETRNGRMYMGAFLYDTDGSPLWFVVNGPQSGSSYSGTLSKFGSGQTLAGDYQAPQLVGNAGNATLSFSSSTAGTITWPGGTVAIQRFPVNGQSVVAPASGAAETGWYWNANESGTGWFFEVQGSNIFLSGYLYDGAGRPVWYVSGGPMMSATAYDGALQVYGGGQTLTGGYQSPSSNTTVGQVSLRFTGSTTATLTLPQGRTIPLTRFSNF